MRSHKNKRRYANVKTTITQLEKREKESIGEKDQKDIMGHQIRFMFYIHIGYKR